MRVPQRQANSAPGQEAEMEAEADRVQGRFELRPVYLASQQ